MKYFALTIILLLCLNACAVGTVVRTATNVAVEVIKVPIKVGGAVVDAVTKDDKKIKNNPQQN